MEYIVRKTSKKTFNDTGALWECVNLSVDPQYKAFGKTPDVAFQRYLEKYPYGV